MNAMLELPMPVHQALLKAAAAEGTTPADWIAERLAERYPEQRQPLTPEEREAANARLWACTVSLGRPLGIDNEQIDADLAREYGDDHAPTP